MDIDLILKREAELLEAERKNREKINKTVSEDIQKLFNEIAKTYNTKWDGDNILLTQIDVRIEKPYSPENVKGNDHKCVERIKTLVGMIKKTIKI